MAEHQPTEGAAPAAESAEPSSLLDAGAAEKPAPGADDSAPPAETKAGDKPAASESKPADDKKAGKDEAKGEGDKSAPSLLADDDEGKSPDEADGQADAKKDGAPETYEAFTLPENVAIDEAALAKATPAFRDVGLSQAQAQKLVDVYVELQQGAAEQQVANFQKVVNDWTAEIKGDPEFGGDNLAKSLSTAKTVLAKFGDAQLRNDLKEWGWGNHPGLIRLLARVGANLSEDTLVNGDAAAQARPKSAAQQIYPNMPGDN